MSRARAGRLARGVEWVAERLFDVVPDARWVAVFRIAFGALATLMAIRSLPLVSYLWWHRSVEFQSAALALHVVWVLLALLVLGGLGGRLTLLAHFLVAAYIIDFEISRVNVEETLYLLDALWLIGLGTGDRYSVDTMFRRRRGRPPATLPGWPLVLMGINLGGILLLAGVTKHFDPLWRQGYGFYYTFLLPWLKVPAFDVLADSRMLMLAMNWISLAFELSFLPLFFLRRARPVAVAMAAGFFAQLAYPFQLGFIGPMGLVMCCGLLAVTPLPAFLARVTRRSAAAGSSRAEVAHPRRRHAVPVALLAVMAFFGANTLGVYDFRYPMMFWPLAVVTTNGEMYEPSGNAPLLTHMADAVPLLRRSVDALYFVNEHVFRVKPLVLFNSVHTVGIYVYRIVIDLDDGSEVEPIRLVDEDLTPGPHSAGLVPRFLQVSMYAISNICNRRSLDPDYRPEGYDRAMLTNVLDFSVASLEPSQRARLAAVRLLVRPIAVPERFAGNADVRVVDWLELLRVDADGQPIFGPPPAVFPSRPEVTGLGEEAWIEVRP